MAHNSAAEECGMKVQTKVNLLYVEVQATLRYGQGCEGADITGDA